MLAAAGTLPQPRNDTSFAADAPSVVPLARWDVDGFAKISPNKLEARFGAFVKGAESFDGSVFRISRWAAL